MKGIVFVYWLYKSYKVVTGWRSVETFKRKGRVMKKLWVFPLLLGLMFWGGGKLANATIYRLSRGVIKNLEPGSTSGFWTLVSNGGAEDGVISPWYVPWPASTKGQLSVSSEHVFSGDYAFKMVASRDNEDTWGMSACVDVHVDTGIYFIGGFMYFDGTNVGRTYFDLGDSWIYDEQNNPTREDSIPADTSSIGWQYVYGEFEFTTPTSFRLRFVRDGVFSKGTSVWFDDVAITKKDDYRAPHSNVVPEPLSINLIGLGLLGFGLGFNRRN